MSQTIHALDLGFCIFYFGTKPKPKESVKYPLQNSATSHQFLHSCILQVRKLK